MIPDLEPLRILRFEFARLMESFVALLPNLLADLIVLVLTWALARYAWRGEAWLLRRWHQRPALIAAARKLTRSFVWFGGLIVAAMLVFPDGRRAPMPTAPARSMSVASLAARLP